MAFLPLAITVSIIVTEKKKLFSLNLHAKQES